MQANILKELYFLSQQIEAKSIGMLQGKQ